MNLASHLRDLCWLRWAAAIDVVGGDTLFNVIKGLKYGGSVAACGLVQSPVFQLPSYPLYSGRQFIRVDSVELPLKQKNGSGASLPGTERRLWIRSVLKLGWISWKPAWLRYCLAALSDAISSTCSVNQ